MLGPSGSWKPWIHMAVFVFALFGSRVDFDAVSLPWQRRLGSGKFVALKTCPHKRLSQQSIPLEVIPGEVIPSKVLPWKVIP